MTRQFERQKSCALPILVTRKLKRWLGLRKADWKLAMLNDSNADLTQKLLIRNQKLKSDTYINRLKTELSLTFSMIYLEMMNVVA
ncbi:MAG: hypothetical protein M0Q98_02420 [Pseudomonas sp.]|nr:hypothetical protein [Pseudomonas sp.]